MKLFFGCGEESIKVTNLFSILKWMFFDVSNMIQNKKLEQSLVSSWLE